MQITPKINLGLYVLGTRPDGFHDLLTVFYPVDAFKDDLQITPLPDTPAGTVVMDICFKDGSAVDWDPQKDLCAKAYRLLCADFNLPAVKITLKKGIPVGAGLGGGSADCAGTIKSLNNMFNLGLSADKMRSYAGALGSDCAFFIDNTPALATGRGEILTPFNLDLSAYEIRVEKPLGEGVSTKEAYGNLPENPERIAPGAQQLKELLHKEPSAWKDALVNDFEKSVFPQRPAIKNLKDRFYSEGALYACMSGSGSAVFGIFEKK